MAHIHCLFDGSPYIGLSMVALLALPHISGKHLWESLSFQAGSYEKEQYLSLPIGLLFHQLRNKMGVLVLK